MTYRELPAPHPATVYGRRAACAAQAAQIEGARAVRFADGWAIQRGDFLLGQSGWTPRRG